MRADGHAELRGEQQVGDVLVDAAHPGGVDLHHVHSACLQQLLEHDAVLHVLAGRDAHRSDAPCDGGVPEDVVGAGRLLDPRGLVLGERVHPRDGVRHVPALVRVDGDGELRTDGTTCDGEAAPVVVEVGTDLELDLREPVGHGLAAQPFELLVGVAEPAGCRRVRGVPDLEEPGRALHPARFGGTQDRERLGGRDRVAEVPEVDEGHQLLGAEPGQVLPEREAGTLGAKVPQGVDHRPDRHVHDALLGPEPAQLRVVHESSRRGAHVGEERLDVLPDEVAPERLEGGHLHVVAPPDREDERVALEPVAGIGTDHDIGSRVVGVGVHRVRPVELERGREADVPGVNTDDRAHGILSWRGRA